MINVSKPFLPPKEKYEAMLEGVWKRNWLTNNGPLVNELELKLKEYLDIQHLLFVTNGTIALQLAVMALELKGEIITTPFTYIASTSSIVWEGCKPVFVDIDQVSLNIDVAKIEAAISSKTVAILATHVYGNPCDIDAIDAIAKKHQLKVIYDAAHCFGTKYNGRSVFDYGNISIASFHANKLFHTIEGGAVFTKSPDLLKKMAYLRNFGHDGPENFALAGINGKNSEFHAAMGLCNLEYIDSILSSAKASVELYKQKLKGLNVQTIEIDRDAEWNSAYYPIIFPTEAILLKAVEDLNGNWIYPRRYFYPSLNKISFLPHVSLPVADDVAPRVLCLPMYYDLTEEDISFIARILLRAQNYH